MKNEELYHEINDLSVYWDYYPILFNYKNMTDKKRNNRKNKDKKNQSITNYYF